MRFRLTYRVTGLLSFLSHLDMMRLWQRALLRSQLPIAWSQGFNPRPKLSLGPAKAVGVEGLREYIDIELTAFHTAQEVADCLNAALPDGIRIIKARELPEGSKLLEAIINGAVYTFAFPPESRAGVAEAALNFMSLAACPYVRRSPKGDKTIDLRSFVRDLRMEDEKLVLDVKMGPNGALRPEELLTALGYLCIIGEIKIVRASLYVEKNGARIDP